MIAFENSFSRLFRIGKSLAMNTSRETGAPSHVRPKPNWQRLYASSTRAKNEILIPSSLDDLLRSNKRLKFHLVSLGGDFIRLSSYRKFKQMFRCGDGPLIKFIVFDMASFIKQELNNRESRFHLDLKNYLSSNSVLQSNENDWRVSDRLICMKDWLYIILGYMLLTYQEEEVHESLDEVIKIYLSARNHIPTRYGVPVTTEGKRILTGEDERERFTLATFQTYINNVEIEEELLFNNKEEERFVTFSVANDRKIYLPPLPRLHDRELMVKALMHKEFYRLLLDPRHTFAQSMTAEGYDLNKEEYRIIRKEISFLDGLGDFFLAQETSRIIYDLCTGTDTINYQVGPCVYNMLKTILATNTVMSKLTKCYHVERGLKDPLINSRISEEYLPLTRTGKFKLGNGMDARESRIFEEEFLGDFFESYMAALLIEQPSVAKSFIREIYTRLLKIITETLPPDVTYQKWTSDILGRNIYYKSA